MNAQTFLDGRVTMWVGDCRAALEAMEPDSVDCVVTSPPYWGLRDYGVEGQIGLEPTLGEHLAVMVEVFEAVRRVLKPTGTLWINYGDCYATSPNGRSAADTKAAGGDDRTFRDKPFSTIGPIYEPSYERTARVGKSSNKGSVAAAHGGRVMAGGYLKAKDLCMVPNRLAIALQEAGWWVRSEIVWAKPNPMPESIRDRPATSHEKVFLLSKSSRYFYDKDAVRQRSLSNGEYKTPDGWDTGPGAHGSVHRLGRQKGESVAEKREKLRGADVASPRHAGHINHTGIEGTIRGFGRNLRNYEPAPANVWNIATQPFSDAHFATFPPELAERCILAGCPKGGLVLDPFGGAGTTALVALRHGRRSALVELNPEYAAMSQRRIEKEWRVPQKSHATELGPLFGAEAAE
ncbi:MAG: site-specific DNA-methyltransferase [Mesorhizobium sp.]|nr:site-specific DNA-methyltransferase [Mesorhizobium sp.]